MKWAKVSVMGRFLETVERYALLSDSDRVLVAVSGGADSVALFDLLKAVSGRFGLELTIFHLNHRLRESARRDEEFVSQLASRSGARLEVVRADVRAHARKQGLGIEEAGRELRYRHMDEVADRLGCRRIALGHTANDNLETMLLNLARGTGTRGLAGIPVKRGRYVRPLLDLERQDLERHLRTRGIAWVEDESNSSVDFRRNLLRQKVVPILEQVSPAVVANARRGAALVADESEFLDQLADAAVLKVAEIGSDRVQIDARKLRNYNNVLQRRVLKLLLPELEAEAVERVLALSLRNTGARLSLTRGVRVRLQRGIMEFMRSKETLNNAG